MEKSSACSDYGCRRDRVAAGKPARIVPVAPDGRPILRAAPLRGLQFGDEGFTAAARPGGGRNVMARLESWFCTLSTIGKIPLTRSKPGR
jgi:hypothetical protein